MEAFSRPISHQQLEYEPHRTDLVDGKYILHTCCICELRQPLSLLRFRNRATLRALPDQLVVLPILYHGLELCPEISAVEGVLPNDCRLVVRAGFAVPAQTIW